MVKLSEWIGFILVMLLAFTAVEMIGVEARHNVFSLGGITGMFYILGVRALRERFSKKPAGNTTEN